MNNLPAYIGYLGTVVMGGLYFWRFLNEGKDKLSVETQERYDNAIKSFELQAKQQQDENKRLNERIKELTATVDSQSGKIKALEGVITARAEVQEIRTILQKFEFIIPMMTQFQNSDSQILSELKELRDMIREVRKGSQ